MRIENRPLAELTPYPANAKRHDAVQVANVAESIRQYGFVQPVVVDRDGVIVIGHCRALAAEKLGTAPAHTLVLEDSYNGVRAGAAGGFVTVMVPDLLPADDEMRGLYTMECTSLNEVLAKLKTGEL